MQKTLTNNFSCFLIEMFHPPKLLDSNETQFTNASKASKKSMESCINTTPNKKFTPTSSNKAQHKDWHCNSLVCMVS